MNKKSIIIIAVIIILIGFGFFYRHSGGSFALKPQQAVEIPNEEKAQETETKSEKASLAIDFGNGQKSETEINFQPGLTAFDLTKTGTEKLGLGIEYKSSSFGTLVEKVNSFKNGQDGKYWMFYVNGQPAASAADKIEAKAGDKIEWKFIKPAF